MECTLRFSYLAAKPWKGEDCTGDDFVVNAIGAVKYLKKVSRAGTTFSAP